MSKPNAGNESAEMDFWSHFAALRPHLVRGAAAVVVIAVAAFFARHFLIDVVLFGPKSAGFPTNRLLLETGHGLAALCGWINALTGLSLSVNPEAFDVSNLDFRVINTAMAGQFNLHMKISFVTGLVLAMPYVLWEFWRFVRPALTQREIAATHRFVFWISACFFTGHFLGVAQGYFLKVAGTDLGVLLGHRSLGKSHIRHFRFLPYLIRALPIASIRQTWSLATSASRSR